MLFIRGSVLKKKLLFVNKNFAVGGVQTSLLNMLNCISDEYDIDLFVYSNRGLLKDKLPSNIKIIDSSWRVDCLGMSLAECLKYGSFKQKLFRIFATLWSVIFDNRVPLNIAFKHQKHLGHYDVAIAYHHEVRKRSVTSGFALFVSECVDADQKISWIHNDAKAKPMDEVFNARNYRKMDKIICVSNAVKDSFEYRHPEFSNKLFCCYNFLNIPQIQKLSEEDCYIERKDTSFICFSACRLTKVKAIPRAIESMASTFQNNKDIIWLIAGDGPEKGCIEETISRNGLQNQIVLLGNQTNPYKYMKNSDMVLLLSYLEAAPMVYTEAKYFKIPVFTTNISSSNEMLNNGKYGIICENNENGIRDSFEYVMSNRKVLIDLKKNMCECDVTINSQNKNLETVLFGT